MIILCNIFVLIRIAYVQSTTYTGIIITIFIYIVSRVFTTLSRRRVVRRITALTCVITRLFLFRKNFLVFNMVVIYVIV
jgi:hypothetical protein